jgi:hypothetical protein
MAILSKGTTYSDGDQVTSTNLNALVDSATFVSGAVDDSTTQLSSGAIIVKDLGIAAGKIATNAVTTVKILDSNVTTAKIADSNVTKAKIENVANMKALGNVSGSAAAPAEVAILDEDNMASNSATSLATQQSIKAYADSKVDGTGAGSFTTLAASGDVTFDTTTLKVDSSNNRVGIGTASPTQPLDVNGQARIVGNLFVGTDDTTPNGMIEVYGGGTGQNEGGEIRLRTAADFDTTYNHYFIDAYEDDLRIGRAGGADVVLNSSGYVGIGTTAPETLFHVKKDGTNESMVRFQSNLGSYTRDFQIKTPTSDSQSEPFRFTTNNAFAFEIDASEAVRIDDSGNVGVGTNNPSHLLDVSPTSNGGQIARFKSDTTNAAADVLIVDQDNSNTRAALQVQGNAGSTECLFVGSNGNVGIGISSPSRILDINDDGATGVGIRVTGGGGGGPLAQFVRDVSSSASLEINAAGGDPQLKLTSSGSDVMAIGLDGSENTFQVCAGSVCWIKPSLGCWHKWEGRYWRNCSYCSANRNIYNRWCASASDGYHRQNLNIFSI